MQIKEIDSSKLLLDIYADNLDELMRAKFPEFCEYKGSVDPLKVAQYIVLMADLQSPMRYEKPDLYTRKYTSAHMAKSPMSKKEFTAEAEKIIIGEDMAVNQTIVAYIASYGLPNYTLLMAFMSLLSFETIKVFAGKGNKDSQKLIDNASDRIQKLTKDFYGAGDTDEYYKAKQALYAKLEKDKMRLRPEQIIRALENEGELPEDFNPYEGYTVDPAKDLQFIGDK